MTNKKAHIYNDLGIHVRPSGLIIQATQEYSGIISLKSKGIEIELKSIMDLLALGLQKDDELEIIITGPDEEEFCSQLVDLFQHNFDFPPK